jgi:hypothetical protein
MEEPPVVEPIPGDLTWATETEATATVKTSAAAELATKRVISLSHLSKETFLPASAFRHCPSGCAVAPLGYELFS